MDAECVSPAVVRRLLEQRVPHVPSRHRTQSGDGGAEHGLQGYYMLQIDVDEEVKRVRCLHHWRSSQQISQADSAPTQEHKLLIRQLLALMASQTHVRQHGVVLKDKTSACHSMNLKHPMKCHKRTPRAQVPMGQCPQMQTILRCECPAEQQCVRCQHPDHIEAQQGRLLGVLTG